jgi:hypothetical protein
MSKSMKTPLLDQEGMKADRPSGVVEAPLRDNHPCRGCRHGFPSSAEEGSQLFSWLPATANRF